MHSGEGDISWMAHLQLKSAIQTFHLLEASQFGQKSFPTFSMFLRDPAFHLQALVFDKEFDNALKSAAKSGGATPEAVLEFENVKEK